MITWMKEMQDILRFKGYKNDIPLDVFKKEFMILSGYSVKKVNEWTDNFKLCNLITIKDNKVNFHKN